MLGDRRFLFDPGAAGDDRRQEGRHGQPWTLDVRRAHGIPLTSLRHSAASDAIAAGVPLALVGTMLGHKHPQTTQRYKHLGNAALQEAARMMGEAIERSTREGAERLRQQQRAEQDDRVAATTTDGGDVVAIDARKVVGFQGQNTARARRA